MTRFVGLDVSQKITAICVVNDTGRRLWRGQCPTSVACSRHSVPGAMQGMPFDRKAEALILHHSVVTLIVPMPHKANAACRHHIPRRTRHAALTDYEAVG